ncbi:MAG: alpha/beta fold hydrolase [Acidimicrobiia bacterium]|nr:alpha/beta fold hydrolase [Acidimicrobiia bacterium]
MDRKTVSVNGIELSVADGGDPDASALLLLHGWPESARAWSKLEPLIGGDFRLLIPDQRGFGQSERPQGVASYAMPQLVADAVGLLDWAGVATVGVVAHDFGGAVAWAMGAMYPERISRMIIMASPHPMRLRRAAIENPDQLRRSFYVWLLHSESGRALLAADGYRRLADWAFGESAGVTPQDRQAYIDEWSQPGAFEAMANWYRANYRPQWFDPAVPMELPPTKVPVLYIHPERDQAFVPEAATGSGEWVDAEFEEQIMVGTSHWMIHEKPQEVAAAVGEWLATGRS